MGSRAAAVDDKLVGSADKTAPASTPRPADWKAIEDVLSLLSRAIQQLHTYPSTSQMCVSAIAACQRAIASLELRDRLMFRVTPAELIVDHVAVGGGTPIEVELARRLHKASVASVTIERAASVRELGRFCEDLIHCGERNGDTLTLLERITDHGIDSIHVEMASRPEVLEVPSVPPGADELLARERARFDAQLARGGVVSHLYPPEKGWVRFDPGAAPRQVTLLDLAVLADDPSALATMLLRLTEDEPDVGADEALDRKYSDVAMLISALDPRVARRMFAKLARAVLDLDPSRRQALLRRSVLPGLIEGRVDGAILKDFPDVDLAESLCLLLDLETAAPELLHTALARLDLPAERQAALVPLLDQQLKEREEAAADSQRQITLARHARELVRVESGVAKTFAEFSAFDLSLDPAAVRTLEQIRTVVPATDVLVDQLTCLWHLVCLEPNPDIVGRFLVRSFGLLSALERVSRGGEVPRWLASYRGLAERLRPNRPDVADVIAAQLESYCTPERAEWITDLSTSGDEGRAAAGAVVEALGSALAGPLVQAIERESEGRSPQGRARAAAQLLIDHAPTLAPALPYWLEHCTPGTLRIVIRALGAAGPGYEDAVGAHASAPDEQTAREAMRALARIGTSQAAAWVVTVIVGGKGVLSAAAEETLWHFPRAEAERRTRELLSRRDFTRSHPQAAERLLDRAQRLGMTDLGPALAELAPLRFRIWKPAVARLARKAHMMLKA